MRDAGDLHQARNGCERVRPDRRVRQRRVDRVSRNPVPQIAELHALGNLSDSRPRRDLRLLRLEEAQESRMLGEENLDLRDSRPGPVLEPGVAEVVLDLVKAAFTHSPKYRHVGRTAPWAERLIRGPAGPRGSSGP